MYIRGVCILLPQWSRLCSFSKVMKLELIQPTLGVFYVMFLYMIRCDNKYEFNAIL